MQKTPSLSETAWDLPIQILPKFPFTIKHLAILCALFGMFKWPFQRLSDLQLGDKKGHFESPGWCFCCWSLWSWIYKLNINSTGFCQADHLFPGPDLQPKKILRHSFTWSVERNDRRPLGPMKGLWKRDAVKTLKAPWSYWDVLVRLSKWIISPLNISRLDTSPNIVINQLTN